MRKYNIPLAAGYLPLAFFNFTFLIDIMVDNKKENPLSNLLFNIALPAIVLMKLSKEAYLGPTWGLIIALAIPAAYFLYDFFKNGNKNFISILGFISILLTGGIGLLELSPGIYAIKEASIPLIIGIAVIALVRTKYSVFNKLLYRPEVFEVDKIDVILQERSNKALFQKKMYFSNFFLATSFFVSAILNFVLATAIVKSPAGSVAFNDEVGRMTMLSYPVIVVPSMLILIAVFYFFIRDIKTLTGLTFEEMIAIKEKGSK